MYDSSSCENIPATSFASLPLDIILYMARLVEDPRFLLLLMAVDKSMQKKLTNPTQASQVDQYWQDLFKRHFPQSAYPTSTRQSGLTIYKQAHQKRNNESGVVSQIC